jgi:spore maturation protein CgeB
MWTLLFRHEDFFTTGMYFERALHKACNVVPVYLNGYGLPAMLPPQLLSRLVTGLVERKTGGAPDFDLVLVIDPVRKRIDIKHFGAVTAYYAIDSHIVFEEHIRRTKVTDYDLVFVAQKDYVERYSKAGCKRVIWLPLACDPEIHKSHSIPQIYDVAFVGAIPEGSRRESLITKVQSRFRTFVGRRYLHDMAETLSQSRIALNISRKQDLNQRVFEAMSCGPLLLTDKIGNGLDELFVDGKHLVTYDNEAELLSKIEYYLAHEEERLSIAKIGQAEVHGKHTVQHRVQNIIDAVEER